MSEDEWSIEREWARDERERCRCGQLPGVPRLRRMVPCMRRMTQEDLLCNHCREHDCAAK